MSEPIYTQFTERMYESLPETVREADALHGYALKHYISAIGDVEDQVERLIARFTYLTKEERMGLDSLADEHSYYGLDYSYFQTADSKNSAVLTGVPNESLYLRSVEPSRITPETVIDVGAVFRTDVSELMNTYGLRIWYYDASMRLIDADDLGISNGASGPQWRVINTQTLTPKSAYYARVSPFVRNTSGAESKVWVDDVYVKTHYEVTATTNLISGKHSFVQHTETQMVEHGDFDLPREAEWRADSLNNLIALIKANQTGPEADERVASMETEIASLTEFAKLTMWSRNADTTLVDKHFDNVPLIQSDRTWFGMASPDTNPAYLRQVIDGVEPMSVYTFSMLVARESTLSNATSVRVTLTPDSGGPTTLTFPLSVYEPLKPSLIAFPWTAPETISTVIVNIEFVSDVSPSSGLYINDVSFVKFVADVTQADNGLDAVAQFVEESSDEEMFASPDNRNSSWIRYLINGYPDDEPLLDFQADVPTETSFIERVWHQTRPGNVYVLSGEVYVNASSGYIDVSAWYQIDGKGYEKELLTRIKPTIYSQWVKFTHDIVIAPGATSFRINLDYYRALPERTTITRGLSLKPKTDRSWYTTSARPYSFNAFSTRAIPYLNRGDLIHYTANVNTTGAVSGGMYGVRVYNGRTQVVQETFVRAVSSLTGTQIVGSFQVPEDQAELRVAMYVDDPTTPHQAAYFLSDLNVIHTMQRYVEDEKDIVVNGGYEVEPVTDDWAPVIEREIVRRNMVPNPIGLKAVDANQWRISAGDTCSLVQVDGAPALKVVQSADATSLYVDPIVNYTPSVGTIVRFTTDIKVDTPISTMRLHIGTYNGATVELLYRDLRNMLPVNGWVRFRTEFRITAMPSTGNVRCLIWPGESPSLGETYYVRNVMIEYDTDGAYFDSDTPDTTFAKYTKDTTSYTYATHVETSKVFTPPLVPARYLSTSLGYNKEDVPSRPDGHELGTTSDLVDPATANTEWLPWLAQFTGRNISSYESMDEARLSIASGSSFSSGTIGSIQEAVKSVLTGTKTVRIFPMTTALDKIGQATQWDVSIVTRISESPSVEVMEEAVRLRNAKPAGVVFHFHQHQSTWDAVELANPTWTDWDKRDWTGIEESGLGA